MANAIGQQNTPRLNHEAGRILFLGGCFSAESSLILGLVGIVQKTCQFKQDQSYLQHGLSMWGEQFGLFSVIALTVFLANRIIMPIHAAGTQRGN